MAAPPYIRKVHGDYNIKAAGAMLEDHAFISESEDEGLPLLLLCLQCSDPPSLHSECAYGTIAALPCLPPGLIRDLLGADGALNSSYRPLGEDDLKGSHEGRSGDGGPSIHAQGARGL
jgi:hypothetical protein